MKVNRELTERIKAVIASKPSSFKEMEHLTYIMGYSSITTLYSRLEKHNYTKAEEYYITNYYLDFLQKEEGGGAGSELKKIKINNY